MLIFTGDFLRVFDVSTEVEGKVTRNEFENYYFNLSASIGKFQLFVGYI